MVSGMRRFNKTNLKKCSTLGILLLLIFTGLYSSDSEARRKKWVNPKRTQRKLGLGLYRGGVNLFKKKDYLKSALWLFEAARRNPKLDSKVNVLMTSALLKAGLVNPASYYFLRVLDKGTPEEKKVVLLNTSSIVDKLGFEFFFSYILETTLPGDYRRRNRHRYYYANGKDFFFQKKYPEALAELKKIPKTSPVFPFSKYLMGMAWLHKNKFNNALRELRACKRYAKAWIRKEDSVIKNYEYAELNEKCQQGLGRAYYQKDDFLRAEDQYAKVEKGSWIWPGIPFEEAWSAFMRKDYNKSLGKLVTYKSPSLQFYFKPEIYILRSLNYMAMCRWREALQEMKDFHNRYFKSAKNLRTLLIKTKKKPTALWRFGEKALDTKVAELDFLQQTLIPAFRSPSFKRLIKIQDQIVEEREIIEKFHSGRKVRRDFADYLKQILRWRERQIRLEGGTLIRHAGLVAYKEFVQAFDQGNFIRSELLSRLRKSIKLSNLPSKDQLFEDIVKPGRRSNQYLWTFNGEYWNDEIGDYVFSLTNQCKDKDET
jgi:tetratricopeptide (TPR) repeat protein